MAGRIWSNSGVQGEKDLRSCCALAPTDHTLVAAPVLGVKSGEEAQSHANPLSPAPKKSRGRALTNVFLSASYANLPQLLVYSRSSPTGNGGLSTAVSSTVLCTEAPPFNYSKPHRNSGSHKRPRLTLNDLLQQLGELWRTGNHDVFTE